MQIATLSNSEFLQHMEDAEKVVNDGNLVVVLKKGQPAHVFMSMETFSQLSGHKPGIIEMLAMPEAADIDFEVERTSDIPRDVDFS